MCTAAAWHAPDKHNTDIGTQIPCSASARNCQQQQGQHSHQHPLSPLTPLPPNHPLSHTTPSFCVTRALYTSRCCCSMGMHNVYTLTLTPCNASAGHRQASTTTTISTLFPPLTPHNPISLTTPLCLPTYLLCIRGLYTSQDPQEQEQLCGELLQLPAEAINRYLLQYVYMAMSKPSGPLERALTQICSRSFNIAVQVRHAAGSKDERHCITIMFACVETQTVDVAVGKRQLQLVRVAYSKATPDLGHRHSVLLVKVANSS